MNDYKARKTNVRLKVLNPDGSAYKNGRVSLDQVKSDFLFGCGAFAAVDMFRTNDESAFNALSARMEKWLQLFNYGTLPFYWGRYEPKEGETAFEPTHKAAEWLARRGVTLKGHPLCWHTVCADWLMKYSNDEILARQIARINRDVTAFKGLIDMWDVINEVVIMPVFDKYDNAITRVCRDRGRISLVRDVFAAARDANPNATLLINDFNTSVAYEILLEALLEAGVKIDVIGIQSHQHQGFWGMDKLNEVLERFERFKLPIHFTENTFVSGHLMPEHIVDLNDYKIPSWDSTVEGEARQAQNAVDMYTRLFEHPLVEAVTTWDFIDGGWLGAPAGVVRRDGSEKPVYRALFDKIHSEWETHAVLQTDSEGFISAECFKGEYSVGANGLSASFKTGAPVAEISLAVT